MASTTSSLRAASSLSTKLPFSEKNLSNFSQSLMCLRSLSSHCLKKPRLEVNSQRNPSAVTASLFPTKASTDSPRPSKVQKLHVYEINERDRAREPSLPAIESAAHELPW